MIRIDFFSDTNVDPSLEMRRAMLSAKVGNEAAAEDPTVNQLLDRVCELLDKPAAIFMPSGTMCNGVAFRAHCQPGDRIIFERSAHALLMTAGLPAGLVGAMPEIIHGSRGQFTVDQLKQAIGNNYGYNIAKAKIVSIEQTTNLGGGAIWPLTQLREICETAHQNSIATHMDGARLLNAVVATGIKASDYSRDFDSVWIDFAKGLGAPVGAVLAGSKDFIEKAWFYKFQQGGVMHQAGILAAGCIYALDNNIERLANDHQNAKLLAQQLAEIPEIDIDVNLVETNIVIFKINTPCHSATRLVNILLAQGIRMLAVNANTVRAIIHMDISQADIIEAAAAIQQALTTESSAELSNA